MTTLRLKNDRHVSPNMYEETLKYICIFERSHYYLKNNISLFFLHCNKTATTQQTLVLMKTSFVFVFRRRLQKTSSRRLQDVLIKTNILVLVIRLQDVFKTFSRRLQDVFKTSSRHLQDVFKTSSGHLQDVFKTF